MTKELKRDLKDSKGSFRFVIFCKVFARKINTITIIFANETRKVKHVNTKFLARVLVPDCVRFLYVSGVLTISKSVGYFVSVKTKLKSKKPVPRHANSLKTSTTKSGYKVVL